MKVALGILLSLAGTGACGGSAVPHPEPPRRTAIADADLRRLVLDVAARDACTRLRNKWIGLPSSEPSDSLSGAAQGLAPITGRWLIRDCAQDVVGQSLHIRLGGPGWQWTDRAAKGFRVTQYVYFAASVELQAALDVGYDPTTRVASVWLTPIDPVGAHVEALGEVNAHAESVAAGFIGAFGTLIGSNPDQIARAQVGTLGAEQMRARLGQGATLTYDTTTGQFVLLLGPLPNGVAPQRPFSDAQKWLANEREVLYPAGFQVVGPFEPTSQATIDVIVEEGPAVTYRAICAHEATDALDAILAGRVVANQTQTGAGVIQSGRRYAMTFAPPPCPWSLIMSAPYAPATAVLLVRSVGVAPAVVSSGVVWVKLTLMHVKFNARNDEGDAWDAWGGAPDPKIALVSDRGVDEIVPKMQDTFEASPMVQAPVVEVSATKPIHLEATDVDVAVDDAMGDAVITLDDVQRRGPSFTVEFRRNGVTTGSADVRVEFVARP